VASRVQLEGIGKWGVFSYEELFLFSVKPAAMEHGEDLFQVRFSEEGKKYIRKFANISYLLMGLVFFNSFATIYFEIKLIMLRASAGKNLQTDSYSLLDRIAPYLGILANLLVVISNQYLTRFPRALIRSLDSGNETDANKAFIYLVKCAGVFLFLLLINTAQLISIVAEKLM
jgi:hypothetical protein